MHSVETKPNPNLKEKPHDPKILAALLVAVALVAITAAVPGLVDNVAYACSGGGSGCAQAEGLG